MLSDAPDLTSAASSTNGAFPPSPFAVDPEGSMLTQTSESAFCEHKEKRDRLESLCRDICVFAMNTTYTEIDHIIQSLEELSSGHSMSSRDRFRVFEPWPLTYTEVMPLQRATKSG